MNNRHPQGFRPVGARLRRGRRRVRGPGRSGQHGSRDRVLSWCRIRIRIRGTAAAWAAVRSRSGAGDSGSAAAENTTLRQRARQLAEDNRGLQCKLQGARSNNRFLDRCIADLEAELLHSGASLLGSLLLESRIVIGAELGRRRIRSTRFRAGTRWLGTTGRLRGSGG
jgi:hypothetical protein